MFQAHREAFLAQLAERGAAALVFSGDAPARNHDCDYIFRPHSDFVYLTGFREPSSALLLLPSGKGTPESPRTVLFLRERDPAMETWHGRRLGIERAPETVGVDLALPFGTLWDESRDFLKGYEGLVSATGLDQERDMRLLAVLEKLRQSVRGGIKAPTSLEHPRESLHELRLFKNEAELELMRKAAAITLDAHKAAMAASTPGGSERDLDALINYEFQRRGGTGAAYNNIVAGGNNACILHYVENDQPLEDGDLCLIDAGCEWDFYASDVTRTFPVNGRFTDDQKKLYQIVLDAQLAAIAEVQSGRPFTGYHEASIRILCQGLIDLEIIEGPLDEALEDERYQRFTIHRTGHWMGLDVHDQGAYANADGPRPFEPGMVVTVEPGLYIPLDATDVDARWRGIGIRIEDDIHVTEDGNENLSLGIPKTIEEVEAACAGN
jgi:Xaa-Pro aminopeptidase